MGAHEIQCRKWNGNRGRPPITGELGFRSPDSIPSGIAVLRFSYLLFVRDEGVALRTQRIDLEDIRIAAVMPGIDDDFEIVVEFLAHIAAELRGDRSRRYRIMTDDAEVNLGPRIEHSYFRSLCRGLAFVGLSLLEIRNRASLLPERIVQRAVQSR